MENHPNRKLLSRAHLHPWHGFILPKGEAALPCNPGLRHVGTAPTFQALPHPHLLLHNEEKRPPVAQALGMKTWGQHSRIVGQGSWQQWYRRGEGAEDPDDIGVRGQLLGTSLGFSVLAKWNR